MGLHFGDWVPFVIYLEHDNITVGFNGQYFDCLKFRTMVTDAPERLRQLLDTDPVAAAEWEANRKLRYGLATLCVGGGMGIATIVERL